MPDPLEPNPTVATTCDPASSDSGGGTDTRATDPTFGPPAAAGEVGTLGPYRVVKRLGKGGMGAVYLATDTRLGRKLALKVMVPKYVTNREARERFVREARAAAQINHDNVVIVHESDVRDGVPYIAMQFLQGCPLDAYLKTKGPPPLAHAVRIAYETAQGLAAAHELGLVHRDIKPANLWLESPHGRVKVLDFGLAKPLDAEADLTRSGAVIGTPAYMSPEQARALKVDHRTDLFSLGIVLYQLCAGRRPFVGPNAMAVLMALGIEEPTPVRELNPGVPEPLAQLIHQLLAKNPDHRPQTAVEVAERLYAILERLLSPEPTVSLSAPVPQAVVPMHITEVPESAFANLGDASDDDATVADSMPGAPRPTGGRGPLLAVGAAVLLAIVAVAVVVWQSGRRNRPAPIPPDPSPVVIYQPPPTPPPIPVDHDRKAAEHALALRGLVRVNGEDYDRRTRADLPDRAYQLTGVEFREDERLADADLVPFKECKALTRLALINCPQITAAGLANFKDCKNLTQLNLDGAGRVTDAGLAHFAERKDLTLLILSRTGTTDTGAGYFRECTGLTNLSLYRTKVTDAGLVNFRECRDITRLDLGMCPQVSDVGLANFRGCKGLIYLALNNTAITNTALAQIAEYDELAELHLVSTRVTDVGVERLTGLKRLTKLNLNDTALTDAGLARLAELTSLTYLDVAKTGVTAKELPAFRAAVPRCEVWYNGGRLLPKK